VVVVIGVGNRHAGDDAVGLELIAALRRVALPAGVELREIEGDTVALLSAWEGARAALLVDAARSGASPGTVHRAEAADAPLPALMRRGSSTHAIGVAEAIELARALGRLPARAIVYGVEAARFETGRGLSEAVAGALPGLAERVLAEAGALALAEHAPRGAP